MSGFTPPRGPPGPGRGRGGHSNLPGSGPRGTTSCVFGPGAGRHSPDEHGSGLGGLPDLATRRRSEPGGPQGMRGINDPLGIGDLGRADLDPFARIGPGTGMLADPRGMRGPQPGVPPNHPQGARFDPYGPVPPQPPFFGTGQPQPGPGGPGPDGAGGPLGGEPDPDHLRMPGPPRIPQLPGQPNRNPTQFGGPDPDHMPPPGNGAAGGYDDMFL